MLIETVDNMQWKEGCWNKLFELVNEYKDIYKTEVHSMGQFDKKQYFSFNDGLTIYFENTSQNGYWLTVKVSGSMKDVTERIEFIYSHIGK